MQPQITQSAKTFTIATRIISGQVTIESSGATIELDGLHPTARTTSGNDTLTLRLSLL